MSEQAVFESMLNKTGTLYRATSGAANSLGERITGEAAVGVTVKTRIEPMKESVTLQKAGRVYDCSFQGFVLYTASILEWDKLLVDGTYYVVHGIEDMAGEGVGIRLLLEKQ